MRGLMGVFGLLLGVFLSSSITGKACSCVSEAPPCEAFSGATAIFVGKVIGAAQQNEVVEKNGSKTVYDVGSIQFAVQEAFVGIRGTEVTIRSGTGGGDCGYWFKRGESYLVYAYGKLDDLSTNICTRTRFLAKAEEDLSFLRSLPTRGVGGMLHGLVSRYEGDLEYGPFKLVGPMVGIKVVIESDAHRFEVVTDNEGRYRMSGLPPGGYDVRIELPQNLGAISQHDTVDRFGSYSGHEKIKVYDRGCAQNNFTVQSDGRVGGRMTDAAGKPVKDVQVNLVKVESADKGWSAWSDANGYYEFRMVQPGQYFLGINLDWVPKPENPYPRTYYPGARDQFQAKIINIGDGTKLKAHDFSLPPRLSKRTVEGIVVWPDDRPAVGASVLFELSEYPGKSLPQSAKVDDKGHFSIQLFGGLGYSLFANIQESRGKYMHSEPIELVPAAGMEMVRMVLTTPGSGYENSRVMRGSKSH